TKSAKGTSASTQQVQGSKAPSSTQPQDFNAWPEVKEVDDDENRITTLVFIRSIVIWERVHDYQLGIERYQVKINLTAPTLVIPGIEALEPYTITTHPFIGIMYENNKKGRRVMNIHVQPKFCDATFNRVLKIIEKIILEAKHSFKEPPLSEEHKEVMELFEGEINELLKLRRQMRK
ncbi:hypothetical protein Tco_1305468, partial [Tanacetum coccineum]